MITEINQIKDFVVKTLEDKKAENITVVDLRDKRTIFQYMIFASGRSTKNITAMADFLADELKIKSNIDRINLEGLNSSEWVLIDAGEIIVHLFHPEARNHYKLEDLWIKGKVEA